MTTLIKSENLAVPLRFLHGVKADMLVADRTAIFYRTDGTWQGEYFYDATVTVAQHQAVVADERYVPISAVADGAWVMRASDPRDGPWTNSTPGVNVTRAARILAGLSAGFVGATNGNNLETGSWLQTQGAGVNKLGYIETQAMVSFVSTLPIGLSSAVRSGVTTSGIAAAFIGIGTRSGDKGWAQYCEGIKEVNGASSMVAEWNAVNLAPEVITPLRPYGGIPVGHAGGLSLASGGDITVNPVSYPANHALRIANNGNTWDVGIVAMNNALTPRTSPIAGTNIEYALHLGGQHAIVWDQSSGAEAAAIWLENTGQLNIKADSSVRVISLADIAINATNNTFMTLPTVAPALPNALWRDGNLVKIT